MQKTKKTALNLLIFLAISIITNNSYAAAKPMVINCSIFNNGLKDISIESESFEKITLAGISLSPKGNHLLQKAGNYEFWVSTYAAILDPKPIRVTDFKIEIRNAATGITTQAVNTKTELGLYAALNMVKYSKENPFFPIAELSFECREDMSQ